MRVYLLELDEQHYDLRGQMAARPLVYHNDNYAAGPHLARTLDTEGSNGIAHDSVHRAGGNYAVVFRPPLLPKCRQEWYLCCLCDGQRITSFYEQRAIGEGP